MLVKKRDSHIFERDKRDFYVEEHWCSERLFDVELFYGQIYDPACGWGRIPQAAKNHGLKVVASDIVDRLPMSIKLSAVMDFLTDPPLCFIENIVSNPPFDVIEQFTRRAFELAEKKVALIFPARRLPAARWLEEFPVRRLWYLTPRPSMPTGAYIEAGGRVGGGTQDYCWVVLEKGYNGPRKFGWLHRDKK